MTELEIDIELEDGVISGTLVTDEQSLSNTVSIIIAGSGPTDRNGNQKALQNHSLEKDIHQPSKPPIRQFSLR